MERSAPTGGSPGEWLTLPPVELVVSVDVAATPDIPLAALRHALVPRLRADGTLADWVLSAAHVERTETAREYWHWRQSWRRSWRLGTITNLLTLRHELDDLDPDLAPRTRALFDEVIERHDQGVDVPLPLATACAAELDLVRLAVSVDERTGTGIVDDMAGVPGGNGLSRTWTRPARQVVLAATPSTAVLVRHHDGLVVLHGITPDDHTPDSTDPGIAEVIADIVTVDLRDDPVVLTDRSGREHRLPAADARPLAWLVPHSLRWHLHEVPIAAVWADVFAGWSAALELATERSGGLVVTSRHPLM